MAKKKLDCDLVEAKIDEIVLKDVSEILNYARRLLINKNYITANSEDVEIRETVAMLLFNILPAYFSYLTDVNTVPIASVLASQRPDYADDVINKKKVYILNKIIEQIKGL